MVGPRIQPRFHRLLLFLRLINFFCFPTLPEITVGKMENFDEGERKKEIISCLFLLFYIFIALIFIVYAL